MKHNQRVNLTGKSYAPIVATLSPASYPFRWVYKIMKMSIAVPFLFILMFIGQSVLAKTLNMPTMPIEIAVETAKKYVSEKNIDVSGAFIEVVEYHNLYNEYERPYWRVRWVRRIAAKGGWFELRIFPDGSIAEIPGK